MRFAIKKLKLFPREYFSTSQSTFQAACHGDTGIQAVTDSPHKPCPCCLSPSVCCSILWEQHQYSHFQGCAWQIVMRSSLHGLLHEGGPWQTHWFGVLGNCSMKDEAACSRLPRKAGPELRPVPLSVHEVEKEPKLLCVTSLVSPKCPQI